MRWEWTNERHPAGDGPWADEPDKVQWIDPETGLDCLIVRNPMGALCGYVGVPPGHPWHGADYDDVDVDVHGGLTFASSCHEDAPKDMGVCHVPAPGRPADVWWLGFDCCHSDDVAPMYVDTYIDMLTTPGWPAPTYKDVSYVSAQCELLAEQVAAVGVAA